VAGHTGSDGQPESGVLGLVVDGGSPPIESDPLPSRLLVRKRGRWTVRIQGDPAERIALDLSLGGLFLAGISLPDGTVLELTLSLGPDEADQIALTGTVRWSRQGRLVPRALRGVGVAFDDLHDRVRARLVAELEDRQ
jgi:hypothetical protein